MKKLLFIISLLAIAGTATAPKSLADTLAEASLTASAVDAYLKTKFNVK